MGVMDNNSSHKSMERKQNKRGGDTAQQGRKFSRDKWKNPMEKLCRYWRDRRKKTDNL